MKRAFPIHFTVICQFDMVLLGAGGRAFACRAAHFLKSSQARFGLPSSFSLIIHYLDWFY